MGSSGREEALGCWVGSLQAPRKSSAGGDVQERAGPRPPARQSESPDSPDRRAFWGFRVPSVPLQASPFASPLPSQHLHSAGFSSSSSALSWDALSSLLSFFHFMRRF